MTTSAPAAAHAPRDDLSALTPKQSTILARASRAHAGADRMLVYALLASRNWDEEAVEDAMEGLLPHLRRAVPARAVTQWYGLEADGAPRPCTALLEDGRGGVARDVHGNPLCVTFGIAPEMDAATLLDGCVWLARRVSKYTGATQVPRSTNVVDLRCRGARDDGRTPPMPSKAMIELTSLLPNVNAVTYVCGAHAGFRAAFAALSKVPVLGTYAAQFVFCDDYSCLRGVVPPEHMLPWWADDATFDFDLDKYSAYLEAEERGAAP